MLCDDERFCISLKVCVLLLVSISYLIVFLGREKETHKSIKTSFLLETWLEESVPVMQKGIFSTVHAPLINI